MKPMQVVLKATRDVFMNYFSAGKLIQGHTKQKCVTFTDKKFEAFWMGCV